MTTLLPGLIMPALCQAISAIVGPSVTVIQANTCNDAQDRIDDVGGIEPPARSHLHDGDIDRSFREPPESKHAPHFAITDCRFCVLRWKKAGRCVQHS